MAGGRPRRERPRDRWWREAPPAAWILIVVGVVAIAVMAPFALGRGQLSPAEVDRINDQSAQAETPAAAAPASANPTATATMTPTDAPTTRVVVIGDSDTGGFGAAGTGEAGWPALLEERLPDVDVQAATAAGAGYVTTDPATGQTFGDLATTAPVGNAALVVVFGSRNDGSGIADRVGDAADAVFADVLRRAPDAQLLVIGPPWPSETVPAGVRNNRDAISAAADAAGATFVDPLADEWFVGQPDLIGIDGVHPTDAGHLFMADQVEPVVRKALGR